MQFKALTRQGGVCKFGVMVSSLKEDPLLEIVNADVRAKVWNGYLYM